MRKTAAGVVSLVAVAIAAVGCSSAPHTAPPSAAAATSTATASATPTPTPTPLTATASVTRTRPYIGASVGVVVSTLPNAWITVVAHFSAGDREKTRRADGSGLRTVWFETATAAPGYRVKVDVRVRAHGQKASSRTSFTPRQKPPPPPPPPPSPAPAPPTSAAPAPSTSAPAPSGCYPRASSGNCYEPGEFCPHADAGMHGVAGDGEAIICENNNGLRWEPA
jgi:hypothetical protein